MSHAKLAETQRLRRVHHGVTEYTEIRGEKIGFCKTEFAYADA
jgi:hypothetical protein